MSAEKKVAQIDRKYKRGFITDEERYRLTVAEWEETTKERYRRAAGQHAGTALQPDPHDGGLRCARLASTRSVSWQVCAA